MRAARDLTDQPFADLIALRTDGRDRWGEQMWRCLCVCGEYCRVRSYDLVRGWTTSCGCRRSRNSREQMRALNQARAPRKAT